jgi:hypothetical protein
MRPAHWVVAILFGLGLAAAAQANGGPGGVFIDPNRVPQGQQAGAGVCLALAVTVLGLVAVRNWRTGLAFSLLVVVGILLTLAALYLPLLLYMANGPDLVLEELALFALGVAVYQAVRLLRRSRPGQVEWATFASVVLLLAVGGGLMADSVYSFPKRRPTFFSLQPVPTNTNQGSGPP